MPVNPSEVGVRLLQERFRSFTAAPIHIVGYDLGSSTTVVEFDPSIQEHLNGSSDTPAGPQPVAATWTVANVRSTYGYVQLTVEELEGSSVGLTAGLSSGGVYNQPQMCRYTARFAVVSPPRHTDAQVQDIFRQIRALYERVTLQDSGHADWPALQVKNLPLSEGGSAWREILERDVTTGWRNDRTTGEFETSIFLRPYASAAGTPIEVSV